MTKVDFRNYNFKNPNRTPPFELPSDLKIKLLKLMKKVDLNCGSIDMIFSKKNEFVFLEINPIGQFGQVSKPCNYNIEELIAKKLIKIVKKNTNGN